MTDDPELPPMPRQLALWQKKHDRCPTGEVFHYTSAAAAISILTTKELWATHVGFANDPLELRYGINRTREILAELSKRKGAASRSWFNLKDWVEIADSDLFDAYTVSFSLSPDLLSQWRYYASGGQGIAIGFEPQSLLNDPVTKPGFSTTIYDPAQQVATIESVVDQLTEEVVAYSAKPNRDTLIAEAYSAAEFFLVRAAFDMKHPSYFIEQEARLLVPDASDSRSKEFRVFGSTVRPYVVINISKAVVTRVIYGPTLEESTTKRWIRMLLRKAGFDPDDIEIRPADLGMRRV